MDLCVTGLRGVGEGEGSLDQHAAIADGEHDALGRWELWWREGCIVDKCEGGLCSAAVTGDIRGLLMCISMHGIAS